MKRSGLIPVSLALVVVILGLFVGANRGVGPLSDEWRYRHLVSLDEKIQRLNEESPWNTQEGMRLFYPGGCGVVPNSHEIVMIHQLDPLILAVRDEDSREVRALHKIGDRAFQFTCKDYPIQITILVTDVFPDGCSFTITATRTTDSR